MSERYFRKNIQEMQGYVPGEQPRDGDIIKLNTNENPYPPSPQVGEVLRNYAWPRLRLYPDPLAHPARDAVAELFGVSPSQVLCGNGSDELLTMVTRAFVDQGDTIVTFQPGYLLYQTLAQIQGATLENVRFTEDWDIPLDTELYRDASLVFLANPNSPSGTLVPPDQILRLAGMLPCPLVVDEAYADFAGVTCAPLIREAPNIIVVRTLSKSYALAGIRFGYLIAAREIVDGLIKVKDSYNCDAISIAVAEAAIRDQEYMRQTVDRICRTREKTRAALAEMGFRAPHSHANFLWYVDGPVDPATLYTRLRARRILVRLLDYGPLGKGVRITVGTDEQMEQLIRAVREIIREVSHE